MPATAASGHERTFASIATSVLAVSRCAVWRLKPMDHYTLARCPEPSPRRQSAHSASVVRQIRDADAHGCATLARSPDTPSRRPLWRPDSPGVRQEVTGDAI